METELTLKLNNESISHAKEYVSQTGTSLSAIVENFFDNLTIREDKSDYTSYLDKKSESRFHRC